MPNRNKRKQLRQETNQMPSTARTNISSSDCSGEQEEPVTSVENPLSNPSLRPEITSLSISGAKNISGARYWAVVDSTRPLDLTATTSPNDSGTWASVTWNPPDLQPGDAANKKKLTRSSVKTVDVTATLDHQEKLTVEIWDITQLKPKDNQKLKDMGGGTTWKGWVKYIPNDKVDLDATTNPAESKVWNELVWAGATGDGAQANSKVVSAVTAGDVEVTAKLDTKTLKNTLQLRNWPELDVVEVQFTDAREIDNDTVNKIDRLWKPTKENQLCYTRNKTIKLKAKFQVTNAGQYTEGTVKVKGKAVVDGVTLEWTSGDIAVNPNATEVWFPAEVASSGSLANRVQHEDLEITWTSSTPDSGTWLDAGKSKNPIYVTLGDAVDPAMNYLTLLEYSCSLSAGATNEQTVITKSFGAHKSRSITRSRDGKSLCYWDPPTTAKTASTVWNTTLLLASSDGHGHCGSWAHFFIDMVGAHGITSCHKVNVTRPNEVEDVNGSKYTHNAGGAHVGFLVATWDFSALPVTRGDRLTHTMYTECKVGVQAPGQNNLKPPPAFYNHFVVYCTADHRIYDTSYGADFASASDWEKSSISGLLADKGPINRAGYDTSKWTTRLLQFQDLTNGNLL